MSDNINKKNKESSKCIFIRPSDSWKFGISKSHLNSLIKNKDIPSYLPTPKLRLVKVEDLINYIEKKSL